ncbi:hypothetical protein EXS54_01590 [Patescibacteria group bacterium]|nr:hypothetical protein [Patescibacteria group bacterium]
MTKQAANVKSSAPPLDWCVVGTLAWFGILGRPLRLPELRRLLLKRSATDAELKAELKKLGDALVEKDGCYSLNGLPVQYPTPEHDRWFRYKWWRAHLAANIMRRIPYVRMVGVGNTLADQTSSKDSDIDVFVVMKHGRLFLGRTLVTVAMQLTGLRRHGKKISNRVCLSFYATDHHLDLSDVAFVPYDIYLAYWVTELTPVLSDKNTYQNFLKANRWVLNYLPGFGSRPCEPAKPSWGARIGERVFDTRLGEMLERRLSKRQLSRINTDLRPDEPDVRIIATESMLKFHEKERRKLYRTDWEAAMKRFGFDADLIT